MGSFGLFLWPWRRAEFQFSTFERTNLRWNKLPKRKWSLTRQHMSIIRLLSYRRFWRHLHKEGFMSNRISKSQPCWWLSFFPHDQLGLSGPEWRDQTRGRLSCPKGGIDRKVNPNIVVVDPGFMGSKPFWRGSGYSYGLRDYSLSAASVMDSAAYTSLDFLERTPSSEFCESDCIHTRLVYSTTNITNQTEHVWPGYGTLQLCHPSWRNSIPQ